MVIYALWPQKISPLKQRWLWITTSQGLVSILPLAQIVSYLYYALQRFLQTCLETKNILFVSLCFTDLPYAASECVKCNSCFRGIHTRCLGAEELVHYEADGIVCHHCVKNRKKRALEFSGSSQRYPCSLSLSLHPPPPYFILQILFLCLLLNQ